MSNDTTTLPTCPRCGGTDVMEAPIRGWACLDLFCQYRWDDES